MKNAKRKAGVYTYTAFVAPLQNNLDRTVDLSTIRSTRSRQSNYIFICWNNDSFTK